MKISFACPACNASGSVDDVHVGKQVRCRHCNARFAIPGPADPESDVYALEESGQPEQPTGEEPWSRPAEEAVFVRARSSESGSRQRERQGHEQSQPARCRRRNTSDVHAWPWQTWLVRGCVTLALLLVAITLFAPHGTWLAGCILLGVGGLLVPLGFFAGAFGAFSEDPVYGFFYLLIPFYSAYYLVTRWEDLWPWVACATAGVGLVLLGTEMIRWAAAPV